MTNKEIYETIKLIWGISPLVIVAILLVAALWFYLLIYMIIN